ncbi:MAG: PIN domain-containing protein [Burkholderiales bacterium]|nr:PIN domain-containing protein [Burkholderiales bacterium]
METVAYLDTHVLAWLYAGELERLSEKGRELVRSGSLRVSPAARLELQHLYELGRTRAPARTVVRVLADTLGLAVCSLPFEKVVEASERQSWTRDPFDRLIVAQASLSGASLLTKDRTIHEHYARAVW